jgi:hypothetical protein
MTRSRLSIVLGLLVLIAGCKDLGEPSTDDMANYRGTIIEQWTGTFLIESDISFQNQRTFYPLNLDSAFKRDGLRIRFSGKIDIDPTAQYILPPIRLSHIELLAR